MKKINLKDTDIKSILEMHVKAGYKSSLLNEDSTLPNKNSNVVDKESYTIGNEFRYYDLENATTGSAEELRLMTGTKFVKSTNNPNILITTKQVKVDFPQNLTGKINGSATVLVYYNCKYGKFGIKGNTTFAKYTWYDEEKDLVNKLIPICQAKSTTNQTNNTSTLPGKDSNVVQDVIDRANKNAAGAGSSKHYKTELRHILTNKDGKKVPIEIGTPLMVDVENGSVKIGDNFTFTCKPEFIIFPPTPLIPTVPSIVPQVQTPTEPTQKSSQSLPSYIVGKSGIRYIEFTKQPQPGTLITMMKKTYCDGNVLKKFPSKVTNKCLIQKPNPVGKIVSQVVNYYYNSKLDACEFGPPTPGAFTDKTVCVKTCVKNQKTTDDNQKQDNKPNFYHQVIHNNFYKLNLVI